MRPLFAGRVWGSPCSPLCGVLLRAPGRATRGSAGRGPVQCVSPRSRLKQVRCGTPQLGGFGDPEQLVTTSGWRLPENVQRGTHVLRPDRGGSPSSQHVGALPEGSAAGGRGGRSGRTGSVSAALHAPRCCLGTWPRVPEAAPHPGGSCRGPCRRRQDGVSAASCAEDPVTRCVLLQGAGGSAWGVVAVVCTRVCARVFHALPVWLRPRTLCCLLLLRHTLGNIRDSGSVLTPPPWSGVAISVCQVTGTGVTQMLAGALGPFWKWEHHRED